MVNQTQKIKPHSGFIVSLAPDFTSFSEQDFTQLYQPIIGADAYALFFALKANLQDHPMLSSRMAHTRLVNRLSLDINQLTEARNRLEAVGMLKSYETTDQIGDVVVYELQPTLTTRQFNDDDLLSILLLEAIGEVSYGALIDDAIKFQFDHKELTETTQSLLSTYHIPHDELISVSDTIKESREQFIVSSAIEHQTKSAKFDFKLLMNLVEQQPIRIEGVEKNRQLIVTEHLMYDIDEVTMARIIGQSINLTTNELDEQKFKRNIAQSFKMEKQPIENKPVQKTITSAKDLNDLSPQDRQLIAAVESYAPNDFLVDLLAEKGGYISQSQTNNLRTLVNRNIFPTSVVNLLIYHILIDMEQVTLTQALMDTVANGWSQAKVKTPIQAFEQIKTYQQKRQTKRQSSRKPATVVRETLPDWAKDDYKPEKQATSAEQLAEIKAQMERLNKSKEGK